ncbi:hypothetical protein ZIOFF_032154 [Zingiber officinale]|uniref:Cation/H+ exchanger transmembrane domain-containing protein n=1 Tax=Zingiber officinale TaxID=94328 RepID=A0A8J5L100_ZINOF|nr:hypothetical protein ZIOFF_032154 [Zingiber officinale]
MGAGLHSLPSPDCCFLFGNVLAGVAEESLEQENRSSREARFDRRRIDAGDVGAQYDCSCGQLAAREGAAGCRGGHPPPDLYAGALLCRRPCAPPPQVLLHSGGQCFPHHRSRASLLVGILANISDTEASSRVQFSTAIVTFAILGTFIAAVVTGFLVYLGGLTFLMYKLPLVECLMFGALISATDPVTVLSIFQELGIDVNLYALVFGESVLNDAIAISLYRTMSSVQSHASSGQSLLVLVLSFLETFVGSMSAGVGVGFISSLISFIKISYVMKHYTFSNLSENSQRFAASFFHLISSLAETFVFIYMGFDITMEEHSWSHLGFIFFSIVSLSLD